MAKEEEKHEKKYPTKTVPAGVESEKLQAEGWSVVRMYHNPDNPLIRLHDLEQRSKN